MIIEILAAIIFGGLALGVEYNINFSDTQRTTRCRKGGGLEQDLPRASLL